MGSTKVEPHPRAVNPSAVAQIGNKIGNHSTDKGTIRVRHEPLYEGRGLKAPMKGTSTHKSGSQGSY